MIVHDAHKFRYKAAGALHGLGNPLLISGNDLAQMSVKAVLAAFRAGVTPSLIASAIRQDMTRGKSFYCLKRPFDVKLVSTLVLGAALRAIGSNRGCHPARLPDTAIARESSNRFELAGRAASVFELVRYEHTSQALSSDPHAPSDPLVAKLEVRDVAPLAQSISAYSKARGRHVSGHE